MRPESSAALLLLLLTSATALSQEAKAPTAQQEAMKKLSFLSGEWKGESWTEMVPGQRSASIGTESVQTKLDGLLLVVEGVYRRKGGDDTGKITHSAFGVLSYDEKSKKYRIQAYTTRGNFVEAEAKVSDKKLEWGFAIPKFGEIRYTITLNEKGQWFEIGEVSTNGKDWRKISEMKLDRVKTP